MPYNDICGAWAFLPHVLTPSSASSDPLTYFQSLALNACQSPYIYRFLIFHVETFQIYKVWQYAR
jgi:hypothetical protein